METSVFDRKPVYNTRHCYPSPTGTMHELKTWPEYYDAVAAGLKKFDIRKNDRPFAEGDVLHLREWTPETREYTGRHLYANVTYLLDKQPFVPEGYVCMSLLIVTH